jgi:hypothetical protein
MLRRSRVSPMLQATEIAASPSRARVSPGECAFLQNTHSWVHIGCSSATKSHACRTDDVVGCSHQLCLLLLKLLLLPVPLLLPLGRVRAVGAGARTSGVSTTASTTAIMATAAATAVMDAAVTARGGATGLFSLLAGVPLSNHLRCVYV